MEGLGKEREKQGGVGGRGRLRAGEVGKRMG